MKTISLCMIVRNEEEVLERCLNSVKKLCDEIIIVDTGSSDKTIEIARKFTDKIYHFEWCEDFAKARNYAFSKATSDYVMWLDADDVVPKQSLKKLIELKSNMCADVYMLKYDIAFENGKPTFSYFRERILKNCHLAKWEGCVHECITPFGKIERLNISIWHKKIKACQSDRNYKIYKQIAKKRPLSPRETYYFARELFDHKKYNQSVKMLTKFINSGKGWIENVIDAWFLMSKCYHILGEKEKEFESLFASFKYDIPRANACCHLGDLYLTEKRYQIAIYWYNMATKCQDVTHKGGFVETHYYNYYPYLQMCVCYYNLGDIKNAKLCNEKAGRWNNSLIVISNKKFFENLSN